MLLKGVIFMPKAIPNRRSTQIRVNETILNKTKYIAELENRNMNSQIEFFLKKGVERYEKENGVILLDEPNE